MYYNFCTFLFTTVYTPFSTPGHIALCLLTDLRAREFYEKPTSERKRKKAAAVKRHFKRVRSMQLPKKMY